jgi:hypothetical protein
MITFRHPLIATLALSLVFTVGVESSYAQNGKFRGLSNRSSSNGTGKSGSSFKLGGGSSFNLSGGGNSNSMQTFSGQGQTQQKSFGKLKGLNSNNQTQSNPLQGITRDNIQKFGRNNGKLQNVLGNSNQGSQILGGSSKKDGHFGDKLNGLQKVLKGNHGQGGGFQHQGNANLGNANLGNGNHSNGNYGNGNHGKGHASKLLHLIQHNQKHGKICLDHKSWCHTKPSKCHWWYNYCKPLAYCEPQHHHYCQWQYVTCDYRVNGQIVHADARWFLGLKGLLLPGQGVGVEEVAPGSPAEAVGLQPGMVITRCNGIDMVDEAALAHAIGTSGGVLQMDLLLAEGTPATCVVVMQRVTSVNF